MHVPPKMSVCVWGGGGAEADVNEDPLVSDLIQ